MKREHKRLKGVRNSFFLNEDGQLELVDKEVSSISTSSNCYSKEIVTIDSSASSSSCLSLSECVTTRDEEIDKAARSMHLRLISKGRREMTNIIKACLDDNSNENTLKKKQLKKTIDAIDYSKRNGTHVSDIKRITNNGTELMDSPQIDSQDILDRMSLYHDEY